MIHSCLLKRDELEELSLYARGLVIRTLSHTPGFGRDTIRYTRRADIASGLHGRMLQKPLHRGVRDIRIRRDTMLDHV
jgi:hypothetical protein